MPNSDDYPHIEAMMDAMAIQFAKDKTVELLEKFAVVISTVGIGLEVLEDEENELVDRDRLREVIAIAMLKAEDLMEDIIKENE